MTTCGLCFFLCHATVIVRVETLEHAGAHCCELSARERAIAVRVPVRTIPMLSATLTALRVLWPF